MCGLSGAYSPVPLTKDELNNVKRLLFLSHWRGSDSVGWFGVWGSSVTSVKPRSGYWRSVVHPIDFAYNGFEKMVEVAFKDRTPNALAFHTRQATKGSIIVKNAHPFNFDKTVGMHNGTFHSGLKYEKEFETDSEALFKQINEDGLETFITKSNSYGAMALVYYDKAAKTLNFYRNSQRPLHFLGNRRCLYWSSEARDLVNAVDIIEKPVLFPETKFGEDSVILDKALYILPENVLLSIDMSSCNYRYTTKSIVKPSEFKYFSHYGEDSNDWVNQGDRGYKHENKTYIHGSSQSIYKSSVDTAQKNDNYVQRDSAEKLLAILSDVKATSVEKTDNYHIRYNKSVQIDHKTSYISGNAFMKDYFGWEKAVKSYNVGIAPKRYAIELNGFIPEYVYEQLAVFRKENPKQFKEKLQSTFESWSKKERVKAAKLIGISLNSLRQIVAGKKAFLQYTEEPFTHSNSGGLIFLDSIKDMTTLQSNVYKLNVSSEPLRIKGPFQPIEVEKSTTPNSIKRFFIGPEGLQVDHNSYGTAIKSGCAHCNDPVSYEEDLFWIDKALFLCENCQANIIKPVNIDAVNFFGISSTDLESLRVDVNRRRLNR